MIINAKIFQTQNQQVELSWQGQKIISQSYPRQVVKNPEIPLDSQGRFLPLLQADRSVSIMKPPKRTKLGSWEPITVPPVIRQLSSADLIDVINTPLSCNIPCHTQSVEHTVALVTGATKRCRSEDTQLANMLQTAAARKNLSGRVTHKRFRMDPSN